MNILEKLITSFSSTSPSHGIGLPSSSFSNINYDSINSLVGDSVSSKSSNNSELYYDLLDNDVTTNKFINLIKAPIEELITKNNFVVFLDRDEKEKETAINDFFASSGFKNHILANLRHMVFRGELFSSIDFKNNKIYQIKDSIEKDLYFILSGGNLAGFKLERDVRSFDNKSVILDIKEYQGYYYSLKKVSEITLEESEKHKKENDLLDFDKDTKKNIKKFYEDDLKKSLIIDYTINRGESFFEPFLEELYLLSLLQEMKGLIGIQEFTRSSTVTVSGDTTKRDEQYIIEMVQNIEGRLNSSSHTIFRDLGSPQALRQSLISAIMTPYVALPSIPEMGEIEKTDWGDKSDILEKLISMIDGGIEKLAEAMGIPFQLFNGEGNRWEIAYQHESYISILRSVLNSISLHVKNVSVGYIACVFNQEFSPDDIDFEFTDTPFFKNFLEDTGQVGYPIKLLEVIGELQDQIEARLNSEYTDPKVMKSFLESMRPQLPREVREMIKIPKEKLKREEIEIEEVDSKKPSKDLEEDIIEELESEEQVIEDII